MTVVTEKEIRGVGARRILYGHVLTLDTGVKIYIARRKRREIFRNGKSSISAAMSEEIAAWAIDESMLMNLRAKGIGFIGIRELDTGDLYLTRIITFFDRKKFKTKDFSTRGGSRQRYVPLQYFTKRTGIAQLDGTLY